MLKEKLERCLCQAVQEAQKKGELPPVTMAQVSVERTQNSKHGDFASNLPMKLARSMQTSPLLIAEQILEHLPRLPEIADVIVAPPGFVNFVLRKEWLARQVNNILSARETYGDSVLDEECRIQFEFVSVNPTGPLHVGHGRGAVLGSTLANVFKSAGYSVEREYYINDVGSQITNLGGSLYTRYLQCLGKEASLPADAYMGDYVIDIAREIVDEYGEKFLVLSSDEASAELGRIGVCRLLKVIEKELALLRVDFDSWFREKSLYETGQYQYVMDLLRDRGYVQEREGAVWFETTALGDEKDNVLVRGDGLPTYFASDIAYHYNKFLVRKFDRVVDIWGADHQGHILRMQAALRALGIEPERFTVMICQMVSLRRGEEVVKASKRSGNIIALKEVIDEVGVDACRFHFLSRSADSQMDFDLELAKKQSDENPVYYVQYAHARIASILRIALEREIDYSGGDVSLLVAEPELSLIRQLILFPEVRDTVIATLEPQYLPYYARDLATSFHSFYKQCRVISDDEELSRARLKLIEASGIVLARVLGMMGITAPERM